ncbi:helix-turn-helix domain-containing protein [Streptomyces sp. NBC_01803]|uniref:helix-turn-helix domain-containing protein n=1 Tax=Streptomyces sp. NBC_01803 TaxID=2975946 RepID=UPI002DDC6781|nr:helix-turn-helix domain-containing protein [Streptomyces sp. NBC_01803]WSA47606.1 helix-turn-helix domain-containing protein [Streptomyces sp. NBC_01803]
MTTTAVSPDPRHVNPDPFLTAKEAAAYLNVSLRTVWTLRQYGDIKATKIGRLARFRRSELDRYTGATERRADDTAEDPLLTIPEAATYLSIKERQVRNLQYARELHVERVRGRVLLRRSELERYAARTTAHPVER